jgi:hypothetical protein
MKFVDDTRGAFTYNIIVFFATMILAAGLYIVLEPAADTILTMAESRTDTQAAADGQQYLRFAWMNAHLIVLAVGLLQLLVAAVYQGEVTR